MNREILFRGKRLDNGEWEYGDLVHDRAGKPYIFHWSHEFQLVEEVDPDTVGQYTGLTDKNGVRIFEGDIVMLKDYHGERKVMIFWGESTGTWFYGGDGYSDEYLFNSSERNVIGNIHDNPELLEGS